MATKKAAKKKTRPTKPLATKSQGGRPTDYTDGMADLICESLATSHHGLKTVLGSIPGAPNLVTVYRWLEVHPEFRNKYTRARELQADYMGDLIVEEAHTSRIGVIRKETPKGVEETVADNVKRSELIVTALSRRMGQLAPKKYVERLMHLGDADAPLQVTVTHIGDAGAGARD